jgi:hypothetical protein
MALLPRGRDAATRSRRRRGSGCGRPGPRSVASGSAWLSEPTSHGWGGVRAGDSSFGRGPWPAWREEDEHERSKPLDGPRNSSGSSWPVGDSSDRPAGWGRKARRGSNGFRHSRPRAQKRIYGGRRSQGDRVAPADPSGPTEFRSNRLAREAKARPLIREQGHNRATEPAEHRHPRRRRPRRRPWGLFRQARDELHHFRVVMANDVCPSLPHHLFCVRPALIDCD